MKYNYKKGKQTIIQLTTKLTTMGLLFYLVDFALVQKMKTIYFKFQNPNQINQVNPELKKKFEISNKFFKICEISDEYELIKVEEINEKILCFEFNDNGRNLLFCTTIVIDNEHYLKQ